MPSRELEGRLRSTSFATYGDAHTTRSSDDTSAWNSRGSNTKRFDAANELKRRHRRQLQLRPGESGLYASRSLTGQDTGDRHSVPANALKQTLHKELAGRCPARYCWSGHDLEGKAARGC